MTMSKPCSISSVTVVYNAAEVLRQHLESLKRQSRQLDQIVVVDNASTDGTAQLLASEYPEVTLLKLPENSGVGGGIAAGLAYAALQQKHDWVWIFDQDSLPASDALERLLSGLVHLNGTEASTAILAPVCLNRDTGTGYPPLSMRAGRYEPSALKRDQPVAFVDMVISSGSLMRREAIERVGLPRRDFFMDFVDYEHCLRLRHHGYSIGVVRDSILDHAIGTSRPVNFLGRAKFWADHVPWREYYMARNETFTMSQYSPGLATKMFVLERLFQHALGILLFGKDKFNCLRMMWHGFLDGRAGRLGIRFRPETHPPARERLNPAHRKAA
jgi:GT2 family glycosyltransferase